MIFRVGSTPLRRSERLSRFSSALTIKQFQYLSAGVDHPLRPRHLGSMVGSLSLFQGELLGR